MGKGASYPAMRFWLCAVALCLPLAPRLLPALIVLMAIAWIREGGYRGLAGAMRMAAPWLFTGYFLLHLAGMAWSDNQGHGWNDVVMKLSFLVMPLLLIGTGHDTREGILRWFITGCVVLVLFLSVRAGWYSVREGSLSPFAYTRFASFHHPSYLAMYLNFAVAACLHAVLCRQGRPWILGSAAVLCSAGIMLLASKTGIGILAATCIVSMVVLLRRRRVRAALLFILLPSALLAGDYAISGAGWSRLVFMKNVISEIGRYKYSSESTLVRLYIWKAGVEVWQEKPVLGTGTGDVKDALVEKYKQEKMLAARDARLNAHNQYLQTAIALGGVGLLVLCGSLVVPAIRSMQTGDGLYLSFLGILALSLVFESMFERQAGIVFYGFFNALMFYSMTGIRKDG